MDELLKGFELIRKMIEIQAEEIAKTADNKTIVRIADAFPRYVQEEVHVVGDIRRDSNGVLKKCRTGYDGSVQTTWTIDDGTLWTAYHGISLDTAYPWVAPTGAHDQYLVGEYMTFTDGKIYRALVDTNYSPTDLPTAWECMTLDEGGGEVE